jgi:hypothetical protein
MPVPVILGVAVAIFGALVLLLLPNRPGGEFEFKGVTMRSPAAGLPLILAGLISAGIGAGAIGPDETDPNGTSSTSQPMSQNIGASSNRPSQDGSSTSSSSTSSSLTTTSTVPNALVLSKSSGLRGSTITVSGGGFRPGETVTIVLRDRTLTKVNVGETGGFVNVAVTIPDLRTGCACMISATGESSGRVLQESFEVR